MVEIRQCEVTDVESVMRFIHQHWAPSHVLSIDRVLFDWQYRDRTDPTRYNFLLAWRGGDLLGVLGYVSTAAFDPSLLERPMLWLALWKVKDSPGASAVGLQLLNALARK